MYSSVRPVTLSSATKKKWHIWMKLKIVRHDAMSENTRSNLIVSDFANFGARLEMEQSRCVSVIYQ